MSKINAVHWRELMPLFDEALELGVEERTTWLQALSEKRPVVAANLQMLLADLRTLEQEVFLKADFASL
jgi:hypothetical protein